MARQFGGKLWRNILKPIETSHHFHAAGPIRATECNAGQEGACTACARSPGDRPG